MLSGGERNRLHLALALKEDANVLLLDEPTNDIDVNTLRALEEGLENFAGCAVVVSHDRWFLDRMQLISWLSRVILKWYISREVTPNTRKVRENVWEMLLRNVYVIKN